MPVEHLLGVIHGRGKGDSREVGGEAAGFYAEHIREVELEAHEHVLHVHDGTSGNDAVEEQHEAVAELAGGARGAEPPVR